MQFSIVAALSLVASAGALPAKSFSHKAKVLEAAASNYTWTLTDFNAAGGSNSSYSFDVSAPPTTESGLAIPAFTASCTGSGIATGPWPCTGTAITNTSAALVNAYLQASNDTTSAHLAVSYQYSTIEGQWGVEFNWTAFATVPWGSGISFTTSPSQVWGVE
ncbi:hypothetical protein M406DRAFT_358316 [Cryphonectria parasitica EP155]|uniref:Uncharacterized protein n=1 Tax=Cryphonectria parasitica (strain ATCC 38755 / EP155) TaxID=660469 RepID=A0A9P4XTQ2_CRYP1|nr:uncharacterized protein M406DRAFT_358316 [Cryphonectria parasitica EP155]KAF3760711.1 hypothetical protein M406DRAFT_358316 [Cryphonectria parasitica EP155]